MLAVIGNEELVCRIQKVAAEECSATVRVLEYLGELERRELHLQLGYSSLFDFCVRKLRYSEPAAVRRIKGARALRNFPEVRELLLNREISLSSLALVSSELSPEVLSEIRGKSKREVEAYVASRRPKASPPREVVRPVVVVEPSPSPGKVDPLFTASPSSSSSLTTNLNSEAPRGPDPVRGPEVDERYELKFSVSKDAMKRIERMRSLLSTKSGRVPSLEDLLLSGVDVFLEKNDPAKREERRAARQSKPKPQAQLEPTTKPATTITTRHIPNPVRDQVMLRGEGCCAYVGPDGTRCGNTIGLQIDHTFPFALGGNHDPENLRLMCGKHNRHRARGTFPGGVPTASGFGNSRPV